MCGASYKGRSKGLSADRFSRIIPWGEGLGNDEAPPGAERLVYQVRENSGEFKLNRILSVGAEILDIN